MTNEAPTINTTDKRLEFEKIWEDVREELWLIEGMGFTVGQEVRITTACQHVAWKVFLRMRPQRN